MLASYGEMMIPGAPIEARVDVWQSTTKLELMIE